MASFHPKMTFFNPKTCCLQKIPYVFKTAVYYSSVMTNRHEYEQKLIKAGLDSGDCCWPILYAPDTIIKDFHSAIADLRNSTRDRSNANCSGAGHFIEQHLKDGLDFDGVWIHCDMVYPWRAHPCVPAGHASGYGVNLVTGLFKEYLDGDCLY